MNNLTNKEKALITFIAIQERKKNEKVQLHEEVAKDTLEVAKLAIKHDREINSYNITNVARVKRRMR